MVWVRPYEVVDVTTPGVNTAVLVRVHGQAETVMTSD